LDSVHVVATSTSDQDSAFPEESLPSFVSLEELPRSAHRAALGAREGLSRIRPIAWWREVLLAVVAYLLYAKARTLHGHSLTHRDSIRALHHGQDIFNFEKTIGIDWEKGLQNALLSQHWLVKILGGYYGGAHFIVTIGVLVWLLVRRPERYRFWRSVLFLVTMVAVVIFIFYPAMPPRLLPHGSGTVDTLSAIGGLWSYNHGVLEHISDPYAPMPSLHLAWATWVAAALWSSLPARSRKARALIIAYPCLTYFTVILTGTHYVIDGLAGMALTAVCYSAVAWAVRWWPRRQVQEPLERETVET
jgi:hypothetical protein